MDYLRLQQAAMVFIVMYVKFVVEVVVDRSQDADALCRRVAHDTSSRRLPLLIGSSQLP